jgi:ferredoxin-NADP reductase
VTWPRTTLRALEAIATPHGVDRYLELIHPMWTVRELRAVVTKVERVATDEVALTLRPNRRWRGFQAGQYLEVSVDVDGVRQVRHYSPSSSEHRQDGRVEITIKTHEHGRVSRWLATHAGRGLVVGLSDGRGEFLLPTPRAGRLLLISGGSGITPVLSMLRTLVDEQYEGELVFLHYARSPAHVAHLPLLRAIDAQHPNVRLVLACTRQPAGAAIHGHFEPAQLAAVAPWYAGAQTYLCGPPGLMGAVQKHYADKGIADRLHIERFTLRGAVAPDEDAVGTVAFGDVSVPNSGATLLEQAEAAGLNPAYGCRMGICFTCPKVKIAGCTRDIRTGGLHTDVDTAIQLCVSVPVGDVAIDM